jgi:hypothetical protein
VDGSLELRLADILTLSESNVERLALNHLLVHLGDSLGGLIGVAEADEAEALALAQNLLLTLDDDLLQVFAEFVNVRVLLLLGLISRSLLLLFLLLLLLFLLLLFLLFLVVLLIVRGFGLVRRKGVAHDLGGCDIAKGREHVTQLLVINIVSQILDVQVDALVLRLLLDACGLVLLAELLLALVLLLSTTDVEFLAVEIGVVQVLDSLISVFVLVEVDESEASVLATLAIGSQSRGADWAELLEELAEVLLRGVVVNVLDVDIGEVGLHLLKLAHAILLGNMVTDVHLLLVQQHAVDVLDGSIGGLGSFVMDEAVSLGVSELVLGDLATENVAKGGKGIVEGLVVNGSVQVLDEDVALASLAQSRITLGPHDTARLTLDQRVVELLERLLAVVRSIVVDVGVAERATGDGVTANTDRGDLANG